MLKKAYVEITNCCNLACSFCPKTRRAPRTMSAQEFDLVLSRLEGYVQYVYLHLMGEPLLHPELSSFFALAGARGMKVCITTNGTLLEKRADELLNAGSLHKISVSLHSFEGNDGAVEQELAYLEQVWDFAEKAAKKGVIVALRLWNDGGADARNGEILDFLRSRTGNDWPEMRNGSFLLRDHLYLERAGKFEWPDLSANESGAQFCYGLRDQLGVLVDGRSCPAASTTRATFRWGISSPSRLRKSSKVRARARCARSFRSEDPPKISAAAAVLPRASINKTYERTLGKLNCDDRAASCVV